MNRMWLAKDGTCLHQLDTRALWCFFRLEISQVILSLVAGVPSAVECPRGEFFSLSVPSA